MDETLDLSSIPLGSKAKILKRFNPLSVGKFDTMVQNNRFKVVIKILLSIESKFAHEETLTITSQKLMNLNVYAKQSVESYGTLVTMTQRNT